jgi:hypothetical protein
MADISDLQVQITLTIGELRNLVAMVNLAAEALGDHTPEIADEVTGLYFQLMENITHDGHLGEFEPE